VIVWNYTTPVLEQLELVSHKVQDAIVLSFRQLEAPDVVVQLLIDLNCCSCFKSLVQIVADCTQLK
jgi:hypothetical protein